MVQGVNKEYIFNDDAEKQKYKSLLFDTLKKFEEIKLVAYCIMSNHAHMLIYTESIDNLSNFMKSINVSYSMYYNRRNDRVGVLFRNRFESQPIINIRHLYNCIVYIHNNPVKAGIAQNVAQYKYSSYKGYIDGSIDSEIIALVFGSKDRYLETFHNIHKNYEDDKEFMDAKESFDYDDFIENFVHGNIGEIIMDESLLATTIKKLVIDNKVPIKNVSDAFNLSRYKINKIITGK